MMSLDNVTLEQHVHRELGKRSWESATALAALSAERVLASVRPESKGILRALLDAAWRLLANPDQELAQRFASEARDLVPDEDEAEGVGDLIYANAAAAIAYVLQAEAEGSPTPAVWALRQAQEAAEAWSNWRTDPGIPAESAYALIETSEPIQREWERMNGDIVELRTHGLKALDHLRSQAQASPLIEPAE